MYPGVPGHHVFVPLALHLYVFALSSLVLYDALEYLAFALVADARCASPPPPPPWGRVQPAPVHAGGAFHLV